MNSISSPLTQDQFFLNFLQIWNFFWIIQISFIILPKLISDFLIFFFQFFSYFMQIMLRFSCIFKMIFSNIFSNFSSKFFKSYSWYFFLIHNKFLSNFLPNISNSPDIFIKCSLFSLQASVVSWKWIIIVRGWTIALDILITNTSYRFYFSPSAGVFSLVFCWRWLCTNCLAMWVFHFNLLGLDRNTVSTLNLNNSWTSSRTINFFIVVKNTKIQVECASIHSKWRSSLTV